MRHIISGNRKIRKEILPHFLLILGFIGAALTEEAINISHEIVVAWDEIYYQLYAVWIFAFWFMVLALIWKIVDDVSVELKISKTSPAGDTVPRGAVGVVMLTFDICPPDSGITDEVMIKRLIISHKGSSPKDISAVYLTMDAIRISPVVQIESNGNAVLSLIQPLNVAPGESVSIDVTADYDRGASAGARHQLMIEHNSSVVGNAQTISGSYPLAGEWFEVGSATSGQISVNYSEFSGKKSIGKLLITADLVEDHAIYALKLKRDGNIKASEILNIYLINENGTVVTNVAQNLNGEYASFLFDPPLILLKGEKVILEVCGTVQSSGLIAMLIEHPADFFCVGSQYGKAQQGQLLGSSIRIEGSPALMHV